MLIELLFVAGIIAGIVGVAKQANRKTRRAPVRRAPRRSWLVKAWNASGATPIKGVTLGDAAAELTGKAAGATVRTGTRLTSRASKAAASAAERRWQARAQDAEVIPLFRRVRTDEPTQPTESGPSASPSQKPTTTTDPVPPADPALTTAAPATAPPGERADNPVSTPTGGSRMMPNPTPIPAAAPATSAAANGAAAPADWAQTITRVANYVPEDDAALLHFMAGEVAGVCGYADGLAALHETCVNGVGLDPSSVQGLAEYSTHASELAQRMAEAHKQFLTIYQEVMEAVARGVVMPYQGRFFSGQAV